MADIYRCATFSTETLQFGSAKVAQFLILDIPMSYSNSRNKIFSTSNTSVFIVDRSRQHVSTLKGSSSGLLFETSL